MSAQEAPSNGQYKTYLLQALVAAAIAALSAFDLGPMMANAAQITDLRLALIGLDYFSFDDERAPAIYRAGSLFDIVTCNLAFLVRAFATKCRN